MEDINSDMLMAYVDGELDSESASAVEAHLEKSPDARAAVAMYRETAGALRSAILPIGHTPVPDRLVDSIRSASAHIVPVRRLSQHGWPRMVAAMAAGLVLVLLGSGGGFLAAEHRITALETERALQRQAAERYRQDAVQNALTTLISGKSMTWRSDGTVNGRIVPIRTYKNRKGQYCREYREEFMDERGLSVRYAVACRHADSVWRNNYVLIPADQQGLAKEKQDSY